VVPLTFITEVGSSKIAEAEARQLEEDLLRVRGVFSGRAHAAAHAIEAARISDRNVTLEHAEALAVVGILDKRPKPLTPELITLRATLAQAPSLTTEFGREA
jgi:hypothetical protein